MTRASGARLRVVAGALALASTCLVAPRVALPPARAETVPIGRYVELRLDGGEWHPHPMTGYDARRSGRSRAQVPKNRPALSWSRRLEQRHLVPPAVAADGSLLVAGSLGVARLGPSGEHHWLARVGPVRFTPIVLRDRSAVVTTVSGELLVVDRDGRSRTLASGRKLTGLPLLLPDDLLVVPALDGRLHVFDLDGSPRRVLATPHVGTGRTALVSEGLVAVAGAAGLSLVALQEGRQRSLALPQTPVTVPVVGPGGGVWLMGREGMLWGISPSGALRFEVALGEAPTRSQPALGGDGALRVATGAGTLVSVGPDGSERWRRGVDGRIGAITLDADDVALFATSRGSLYAVEADGELRWRLDLGERGVGRPVLGADGTLYLVSAGGQLHAWR